MKIARWTPAVSALGVIEIFAWGSTFYLMAVLSGPIAKDTGWSVGALSAGVSVGLLVSGLAAPFVGRIIQAVGGRNVLASGMALIAIGLFILGFTRNLPMYFAAWVILGLAMAAGLYEAAFSTLGRLFGKDARSAITELTIWGGFATTICWPISAILVESIGWRGTCFAYAAFHLAVSLPLCILVIPRAEPKIRNGDAATQIQSELPGLLDLRFLCLLLAGVTMSMLGTLLSIHLITILIAMGQSMTNAIALGALMGPAMVGARLLEMFGRGRHHPIWTMGVATSLECAGFVGLLLGAPASAGLIAYGAGVGLWSIARGALPLSLFEPDHYPRIVGRLALPTLIASACAPTIGSILIETFSPDGCLKIFAAASLLPCLAVIVLATSLHRQKRTRIL